MMKLNVILQDTTLESARLQYAILRKIGLEGRARMTFELSDNLREIVASGVRSRHPDYDEHKVKLAVIRLTVGKELFQKAYPGVEIEV